MRFRLIDICYLIMLVASGMRTFGASIGVLLAGSVAVAWWIVFLPHKTMRNILTIVTVSCVALALCYYFGSSNSIRFGRRPGCLNNLRNIALGIAVYESANQMFPPAYTTDAAGRRLHSWRTLILPYIEEQGLHDQIRFDEPWDSIHNQPFTDVPISIYQCPNRDTPDNYCDFVAVVGPETGWQGDHAIGLGDITDGVSNTIMLVEAPRSVPWAEPRDISVEEFLSALHDDDRPPYFGHQTGGFLSHTWHCNAVRFDVSTVSLSAGATSAELAKKMLTISGGETAGDIVTYSKRWIRWDRVIGLSVFVLLSLAPLFLAFRRLMRKH